MENKLNPQKSLALPLWLLAGTLAVATSFFWAQAKLNQSVCKGIHIKIKGDGKFITENNVLDKLGQPTLKIIGYPLSEINIEEIEDKAAQNPFVEKVDVFTTLDGNLNITVWQRQPILRIINRKGQNFYIDEKGKKLPFSPNFSPYLPVANGHIEEEPTSKADSLKTNLALKLYQLARFLYRPENRFWKAQIEQIYVNNNLDIELVPRVGKHKILLGDVENLEKRLNNLWVFYNKALPRTGWDTYKLINIKYDNQIIGVRTDSVGRLNVIRTE